MPDAVALLALILDAAIGWPAALYRHVGHPVGIFARIINTCEKHGNKPRYAFGSRRMLGIATMLVLVAIAGGGALMVEISLVRILGPYAWIGIAVAAFPALAQRSLYDHVRAVAMELDRSDLPMAQQAVAMIVGRDVARLDEAGVSRAAIESLSESFCDGVVAPLFWLLLLGLPGIWAYKAINTADSLIGHREDRWRAFGWAAARIDDVANLAPARLGGVLICLSGISGWRTMCRDARLHASPNAGWTEAAMAGVIGVCLGGPVSYDGVPHEKPWIGTGRTQVGSEDISRALAVYRRSCLLLWLIAGATIWAM